MMRVLLVLSIPAVFAWLVLGLSTTPKSHNQSDDHPTVESLATPGPNVSYLHTQSLGNGLELSSWMALGAPLLDQSGHVVRPAAFSCAFLYQRVQLGELHSLRAFDAVGHEALQLDLSGLDVSVADPALEGQVPPKSYRIDVSPKPGLSWEGVVNPASDVVIAATLLQ